MDRPTLRLPGWVMLLPIGLALAGLSWSSIDPGPAASGNSSPAAGPATLRAVSPDTLRTEMAGVRGYAQPRLLPAEDWARRLSRRERRASMVLPTGLPDERDAPQTPAETARPELRNSPVFSAVGGLSVVVQPGDAVAQEPDTDPQPEETTDHLWTPRDLGMSITVGPADAFRSQFARASAQPKPDVSPEIGPREAAETDPDQGSEESDEADRQRPGAFREPAGSRLLLHQQTMGRSEHLERVAQQADRQIRRGFELASRRAYFAARLEFIRALRLIAQGLDTEHQTPLRSRALALGLTAIKEAEDFLPDGSGLEGDLDVSDKIGSHRTPVLKNMETNHLTSMLALKCYFTFAQEQLATGAGREVAGSMALHALGKLYGTFAAQKSSNARAAEPKAMLFYQAALLVCPQNHLAANDLGVLLARGGNYPAAEAALKQSLSIHRQSTAWHNLAVVYRELRQPRLARRAAELSAVARHAETARRKALNSPSNELVRWVDPKTFGQVHHDRAPFPQPTPAQEPIPARRPPTRTKPNQPGPALRASNTARLPGAPEAKTRK